MASHSQFKNKTKPKLFSQSPNFTHNTHTHTFLILESKSQLNHTSTMEKINRFMQEQDYADWMMPLGGGAIHVAWNEFNTFKIIKMNKTEGRLTS